MKEININEIVMFQFQKKDKHKVYAHAKKTSLKINIFSRDSFLLGVYLPKKTVLKADLIIDIIESENFIAFLRKLKNNGVITHIKVYESSRYILLDS